MTQLRARFHTTRHLRAPSPTLTFEVAYTPDQLARGLMGRDQLMPGTGMLFAFASDAQHSFWMKNTRIPLDIAWLSARGVVLEIASLKPYDETQRYPSVLARYAVELPAGTLATCDVRVGDVLVVE